jgi:hypothetical protein
VRRAGSCSKDTGTLSTDVSASEHDEDDSTEKATRKRKIADKGKGRGRERAVVERPKVEYMKDKQCDKGEGREDDGEWLIIDLCDDNGVFSSFFSHCDITSRVQANRSNNSFWFRCVHHVAVTHYLSPHSLRPNSDFQLLHSAFTPILRILHCHCPHPITFSQSSTIISNTGPRFSPLRHYRQARASCPSPSSAFSPILFCQPMILRRYNILQ